jgi:hypothetical protein
VSKQELWNGVEDADRQVGLVNHEGKQTKGLAMQHRNISARNNISKKLITQNCRRKCTEGMGIRIYAEFPIIFFRVTVK